MLTKEQVKEANKRAFRFRWMSSLVFSFLILLIGSQVYMPWIPGTFNPQFKTTIWMPQNYSEKVIDQKVLDKGIQLLVSYKQFQEISKGFSMSQVKFGQTVAGTSFEVVYTGIEVKDDSSNIDLLAQRQKINPELITQLKQANSMRNIIVHRYNGIEEQIINDSIAELKELMKNWLSILEGCIDELSTDDQN